MTTLRVGWTRKYLLARQSRSRNPLATITSMTFSAPSPPVPSAHDDFAARNGGNTEWSDIPRLKEKHEKEGYRDGVTRGKAESVQKGFDEGYGLGAVLGLRVGKILGLLEGISAAVNSTKGGDFGDYMKAESERLESLLGSAKSDLKTESVFGKEYFDADGIWRFPVDGEGDGKDVVFPDIADSHPLIRKWEDTISGEVRTWNLDLGILENEVDEKDTKKVAHIKETTQGDPSLESKKGMDW